MRSFKIGLLALACAALFLTGCSTVTSSPVAGLWTQEVTTGDNVLPSGGKQGRACATSYLGVFAIGDASVDAAARAGGISKVQAVQTVRNAWIVVGEHCTVVYGN